jgi:hypothetical protein
MPEERDRRPEVESDVRTTFERFLTETEAEEEEEEEVAPENRTGYRTLDSFGDQGVVEATVGGSKFTFVRWRWNGHHRGSIPMIDDEVQTFVRPTGNRVSVDGLTILEEREDGVYARRFIDWLSVYAQMGLVFAGRPVGMANTQLIDHPEDRLRRADRPADVGDESGVQQRGE